MIVANRYAKSLMDLAIEHNQLEAIRFDMKSVENLCNANREFSLFLQSPIIQIDKKIKIIESIFTKHIHKITLNFLILITKKHRAFIIKEIAIAFDEQFKINKNIFTAIVTSAAALDTSTKKKIEELIKSQMNGDVEIIEKIDPNTIGGFILKVGDVQIDKSVSRQLNDIKKQLTSKILN
jgi:F-type H+-transporting ATPase subunit delta